MAVIDVKITDLQPINSLKGNDLFLVSHPLVDSTGAIDSTPYTSNCISGNALSSSIVDALTKGDVNITGKWKFHTNDKNIATQDVRIQVTNFANALSTPAKLSSIINDSDENGWYHKLSTSVLQISGKRSDLKESTDLSNNSIANIDFVERAVAVAYNSLFNQIKTIINPLNNNGSAAFIPSHVGQIIISTRLKDNAYSNDGVTTTGFNLANPALATNIRQFYGYGQTVSGIKYPNTKWIRHNGYFLRGASSSQPNNNTFTDSNFNGGGQDEILITKNNLPNHTHTATFTGTSKTASATIKGIGTGISTSTNDFDLKINTGSAKALTSATLKTSDKKVSLSINSGGSITVKANGGSDNPTKIKTLPKYKNVYIWERVQ